MHSKIGVEKIMTNDKAVKVIKLFKSLLNGYQNNLEKLMKGLEFVYDYVHLLYYKYQKLNLDHDGSYTDSPNLMKNKKATINLIYKKDKNAFNML